MKIGLGIDAGGTYTDSVLYDFESGRVLSASKALTTPHRLELGIQESLLGLNLCNFPAVQLTVLSTTHATNACVEGHFGRGRLLLMGYDEKLFLSLAKDYGITDGRDIVFIPGSHKQNGDVKQEPDWSAIRSIASEHIDDTDAWGIAEYWGIRNSEFERKARELIREVTGKPAVCASELCDGLSSIRRASTALLNAGLIPTIAALMSSVKVVLADAGISSPVMVVRGDGTLMSMDNALEAPVDTLLSGPAASVAGGLRLSGLKDALFIDVGGTTSDLALVTAGRALAAPLGVTVGGRSTGTKAIELRTVALGGDSSVSFDKELHITVGPARALPVSQLALREPRIKSLLRDYATREDSHYVPLATFFLLRREPSRGELDGMRPIEQKIVKALTKPLSLLELAEAVNYSPWVLKTERLEERGIVIRSTLTPTDILHTEGRFTAFDREAAELAAEGLARRLHLTVEELAARVWSISAERLYKLVASHILEREGIADTESLGSFIHRSFEQSAGESGSPLVCPIHLGVPLVGLGAAADAFIPMTARALGTEPVLPEFGGVANAVGAITGAAVGRAELHIRPIHTYAGVEGYTCYLPSGNVVTEELDEAIALTKAAAAREAIRIYSEKAVAMGIDCSGLTADAVDIRVLDRSSSDRDGGVIPLETVIEAECGN